MSPADFQFCKPFEDQQNDIREIHQIQKASVTRLVAAASLIEEIDRTPLKCWSRCLT